jgi:hypothetical protein
MHAPARRLVFLVLAAAACACAQEGGEVAEVALPPPAQVRTFETPFASIAGTDAVAVENVRYLAEALPPFLRTTLDIREGFPTPVLVRLVGGVGPAGRESAVAVEPGALVTLWLRDDVPGEAGAAWREGLVQAVLTRWLLASGQAMDGRALPAWLVAGLDARLAEELEPSLGEWLQATARGVTPPALGTVLAAGSLEFRETVNRAASYILVRWLLRFPDGPGRLARLARALVAGAEPRSAFLEVYGDLPALASGAQAAWLAAWVDLSRQRTGPLMAAAASREAIVDLARVVVMDEAGVERVAGEEDLWALRSRRAGRELALARWRTARAVLLDAHPFYFNAALSVGRLHEALLRGRKRSCREAWAALREDLALGDRLEAEAAAAVAAWDARLAPAP